MIRYILEHDRIVVFGRIDVNKASESLRCIICIYYYFFKANLTFQPKVCDRYVLIDRFNLFFFSRSFLSVWNFVFVNVVFWIEQLLNLMYLILFYIITYNIASFFKPTKIVFNLEISKLSNSFFKLFKLVWTIFGLTSSDLSVWAKLDMTSPVAPFKSASVV